MTDPACWPDSNAFWRNQRVVVTGGAGFLGSFIGEKLQARGAAEIFVPRIEEYDLRDRTKGRTQSTAVRLAVDLVGF